MSYRKRPLEPQHGNSPPEKRNRPPERSDSIFDKVKRVEPQLRSPRQTQQINARQYASPKSRSIPSPPSSRKNSVAGLPANPPNGPAATRTNSASSHRDFNGLEPENGRPRATEDLAIRTDCHVASPGSIGSGASTPAQVAPPAPSMLPVSRKGSMASHSPQQDAVPNALASMRNVKLRRQALAKARSDGSVLDPASTPSHKLLALEDQVIAQQSEIALLKKERDDMWNIIRQLENHPNLKATPLQAPKSSEQLDQSKFKDALEKVDALVALDLPSKVTGLENEHEKVKALQSGSSNTKNTAEKRVETVKDIDEIVSRLRRDVASLKSSQETQSTSLTRDQMKDLLSTEMKKNHDEVMDLNRSLIKLSEGQKRQVEDFFKRVNTVRTELDEATEKLDEVIEKESKTFRKARVIEDDVEKHREEFIKHRDCADDEINELFHRFNKYIGSLGEDFKQSGKTVLERLGDLERALKQAKSGEPEQQRLLVEFKKVSTCTDELSHRVEVLEKHLDHPTRPGFKKVGTPAQPNVNDVFIEATKNKLKQLDEQFSTVEITSEKHNKLAKEVENLSNRITNLDQTRMSMQKTYDDKLSDNETRSSKQCEELSSDIARLRTQIAELEQRVLTPLPGATQTTDLPDPSTNAKLQHLETEVGNLYQGLEQLDQSLQEAERKAHEQSSLIQGLQETVPSLFKEKFDPLESELKEQLIKAQTNIAAEAQSRKDAALVQDQYDQDLRIQLAKKADIIAVEREVDKLHSIIKNLVDRYNNITTDDMYQRMAHWFSQAYPSPTANMMHQFSAIQHDFASLQRDFARVQPLTTQLSWIQARSHELTQLLNSSPRLQALLNGTNELQQLPQTIAKVDEAWDNAKAAVSKSEEAQWKANQSAAQTAEMKSSLAALHTQLYNVNTSLSSHTKIEDLHALKRTVGEWQNRVHNSMAAMDEARLKLATELQVSAESNKAARLQSELQLRTGIEEIKKIADTIQPLVAQLRSDFDSLNEYVDPYKGLVGTLVILNPVVQDLQKWVEDLNENLDNPLKIDWVYDMATATSSTARPGPPSGQNNSS